MKKFSFLLSTIAIVVAVVFVFLVTTKVWGQNVGYIVWVKQSPCSGEFDMLSVANENPTYGGGGSFFYSADLVIMGFPCTKLTDLSDSACTFAAAQASMASIKASGAFPTIYASHCCRDYSVWKNEQTGAFSIVQGKFGTAGFGWSIVQGDLCCKDAEALAGLPGACSGGGGGGGGMESDTALTGTTLTFYARNSVEECQSDCANNANCKGFTWIKAGTYNPSDAAMCYLLSAVTGRNSAHGHISAVKGSSTGTGSTGGGGGPSHSCWECVNDERYCKRECDESLKSHVYGVKVDFGDQCVPINFGDECSRCWEAKCKGTLYPNR